MSRRKRIFLAALLAIAVAGSLLWWWNHSHSGAVLLSNARIALDQGDPAQAARLAQGVLKRNPDSYEALGILAPSLVRVGDYELARRAADRAAHLKPDDPEPAIWKVRAYRAEAVVGLGRDPGRAPREDLHRAIKTLQMAVATCHDAPDRADPDRNLALERGLTEIALAKCHRILQSESLQAKSLATASGNPADARQHDQEAEKQAALAQAAEDLAIEALERATNGARPSAEAGEELQNLYEQRGLYEKALAVYERLNSHGRATERVSLQAVGAILAANAREPGSNPGETIARAKQILQAQLGSRPDSRDAQIAIGRLTLFEGNTAAAGRIVDDVLKHDPTSPHAQLLKAQVLLAQAKFEDAKRILQPISTFYPNWLEIQYSLAIAQMETGYESIAQQTLRRILVLNPQYFPARLRLAESLCKSESIEAAEAELREAVTTSSSKDLILPAIVNLVWQYATADRAAAMVDAALAAGKSSPRLLETAAAQYWRLGKIRQAQDCLARAGTPEDRSPTAKLLHANHLIEMNQPSSAEVILTKLLDDPGAAVDARIELARLRYRQGRGADAHDLLAKALTASNVTVSQRLAIAEAYFNGDDLDGALGAVRAVLASDKRSHSGQMLLANTLLRRGDTSGAKEAFAAADRVLPVEDATPEQRANLAMLRGDFARCAEVCESALRADDASPSLHLVLAGALEQLGRIEDAAAHIRAYIEAEPANIEGYTRLALLYLRANRPADGLKALETSTDTQPSLARFAESQIIRAMSGPSEAIARLAPVLRDPAARLAPEVRLELATTLATWQAAAGRLDDAVKTFDWLDSGGENAAAAWGRFGLFVEGGQSDAARQELNKIERMRPVESMTPPDLERLVRAQLRAGDAAAALATVAQYAKVFPETDGPARLRIEIERRSGRLPEAITTFREAARNHGQSIDLLADGVALLVAAHDYPGAEEVLGQLSKTGPTGLLRAATLQANVLTQLGLHRAAVAGLTKLKEQLRKPADAIQIALGKALANTGQLDESDAALRAVPPYSPHYVEARRAMADNARKRGQPREGLAFLDQALQRDPSNAEAAAERIRLHLALDEVRAATDVAETILRRVNEPSQHAEWTSALAELQWLAGNAKDVERTLRALKGPAIQAEKARVRLAILLLSENRDSDAAELLAASGTPGAEAELVRSLLILASGTAGSAASSAPADSPNRQWVSLRALAIAAAGNAADASGLLRSTPTTDLPRGDIERVTAGATDGPARARVRKLTLGRAMSAAGLRRVGLQQLTKLSKEWPEEALVWQSLREALLAADRPTEAEQVADRVRRQHGDSVVGKELAADKAMGDRRYEEAWKILGDIESSEGETAWLCIKRGEVLDKEGKPAEAVREYQRAFETDPTCASALNNAAYTLANSNRQDKAALDQAFEMLRKAASLGPVTPAILDTLGWVQVLRGDVADGLRSLSTAIPQLRDEPIAHYHIGVAYKNAGKPDWARMHLENVLSLAAGDLPEKRLAAELLTDLRMRGRVGAP